MIELLILLGWMAYDDINEKQKASLLMSLMSDEQKSELREVLPQVKSMTPANREVWKRKAYLGDPLLRAMAQMF